MNQSRKQAFRIKVRSGIPTESYIRSNMVREYLKFSRNNRSKNRLVKNDVREKKAGKNWWKPFLILNLRTNIFFHFMELIKIVFFYYFLVD